MATESEWWGDGGAAAAGNHHFPICSISSQQNTHLTGSAGICSGSVQLTQCSAWLQSRKWIQCPGTYTTNNPLTVPKHTRGCASRSRFSPLRLCL